MPTPAETQQQTLAWYVNLAAHPGWKAQAWHSVNQLAREHPALFADLPAQLTAAMREKSSAGQKSSGG